MMIFALITVFGLTFAQAGVPVEDVHPAGTPETQPAGKSAAEGASEAQQIEDAAKLIIGDNTVEARQIGVRTLLRIGTPAAFERLAVILTEPDQGNGAARSVVCAVLAASDSPPKALLAPLVRLAADVKGPAFDSVRAALAAYPQAEAQAALCAAAQVASTPTAQRVAVIDMIGRLGEDYAAAGILAGLLTDENAAVANAALSAFSRMTGVEFEDAETAAAWWRERAGLGELKWLVRSNQRRRDELRALRTERQSLVERLVAAYRSSFVTLSDKDQGERLVAFLKDDVPDVRQLGLNLIAAMVIDQKEVAPEVRSTVLTLLSDPVPEIRQRAAVIAGNLRIAGAEDVMIDGLKTDHNATVRVAFAGALGRMDDVRAIDALLVSLGSKDRALVAEATLSLGALARHGHADATKTGKVSSALEKRFGELAPDDSDLREKFLRAMARIGGKSFRPIFKHEAASGRSAAVRTAAISGLATYDDGDTAKIVMGLLDDEDALVRGAATQALGRCGTTVAHFQALFERAGTAKESDSTVRDKAWDAAKALFGRLSGEARYEIVSGLSDSDDVGVQRRRAALARSLKQDRAASNELTPRKRLLVGVMLADALLRSGDTAAALTEYQGVATQRNELPKETARQVDVGLIRSAMRGGKYEAVVAAIRASLGSEAKADQAARSSVFRKVVDEALSAQIAAAQDGKSIAALNKFIGLASSALESGDDTTALASSWASRLAVRRDALIDALLDEQTPENTAADRFKDFDKKVVISRIHARLSAIQQTTTGPSQDREAALIALARQLAPNWPGYEPGVPVEARKKALDELIAG